MGADPKKKDDKHLTPLMRAGQRGHWACVELLASGRTQQFNWVEHGLAQGIAFRELVHLGMDPITWEPVPSAGREAKTDPPVKSSMKKEPPEKPKRTHLSIEHPHVKLGRVKLPRVKLPRVKLPRVKLPHIKFYKRPQKSSHLH